MYVGVHVDEWSSTYICIWEKIYVQLHGYMYMCSYMGTCTCVGEWSSTYIGI